MSSKHEIYKLRFQSDVLLVRKTPVKTFSLKFNELGTLCIDCSLWIKEAIFTLYIGGVIVIVTEEFRSNHPCYFRINSLFLSLLSGGRYFLVAKTCTVHEPYGVKTSTLFIWRNLFHVITNY